MAYCKTCKSDIDAVEGTGETVPITDVTQEVPDHRTGTFRESLTHFMLLELVAAENYELLRLPFTKNDLNTFLSEGTRPTREQDGGSV